MNRILGIRQTTPVDPENNENREGIRIAQHELRQACQDHSDGAQEVVIPAQPHETGRWGRAAPSDEDENRRGVRDQEGDETEERGVSEAFRVVAFERFRGLEEQAFVLVWAHCHGDLATQRCAVRGGVVVGVDVLHFVVDVGCTVHFVASRLVEKCKNDDGGAGLAAMERHFGQQGSKNGI